MVAEEAVVTLSGGAPWGFRLQGGVEHQKALQVAKVRQVPLQAARTKYVSSAFVGHNGRGKEKRKHGLRCVKWRFEER